MLSSLILIAQNDIMCLCFGFQDLDNKPKRLLRNIPAQHLYLRMATNDDEIMEQLEKIKAVELQHLFLASSNVHAERYLGMVNIYLSVI